MYFYNLLLILVALLSVSAKCSVGNASLCNTPSLSLLLDQGGVNVSCVNTNYVAVCMINKGDCVQMKKNNNNTWKFKRTGVNNANDCSKTSALLFKSDSSDAIRQFEKAQQNRHWTCKTLFPKSQDSIKVCNK